MVVLSNEELFMLTGKLRRGARMRVLTELGVPFLLRADGMVLVSRAKVEHLLGCEVSATVRKRSEPNWSALAKAS